MDAKYGEWAERMDDPEWVAETTPYEKYRGVVVIRVKGRKERKRTVFEVYPTITPRSDMRVLHKRLKRKGREYRIMEMCGCHVCRTRAVFIYAASKKADMSVVQHFREEWNLNGNVIEKAAKSLGLKVAHQEDDTWTCEPMVPEPIKEFIDNVTKAMPGRVPKIEFPRGIGKTAFDALLAFAAKVGEFGPFQINKGD